MNITACGKLCRLVPELIDKFNGDGPKPAAVTVGGMVFAFEPLSERQKRHERKHVLQAAAYCPKWLRWLPLSTRAWLGAPKFWAAYVREHGERGYVNNRFEIEARVAETEGGP